MWSVIGVYLSPGRVGLCHSRITAKVARNQNTRLTVTVSMSTGRTGMIQVYSRTGNTTQSSLVEADQKGRDPYGADTISSLPPAGPWGIR